MSRRGVALAELAVVIVLIGILSAILAPSIRGWRDQHLVERARSEMIAFHEVARFKAIARAQRVRLEFAPERLRAVYEGVRDSLAFEHTGPARFGVGMRVSRERIRIGPNGLGWGAANTKIVLWRGLAAESLTVSRLGRLKRW